MRSLSSNIISRGQAWSLIFGVFGWVVSFEVVCVVHASFLIFEYSGWLSDPFGIVVWDEEGGKRDRMEDCATKDAFYYYIYIYIY